MTKRTGCFALLAVLFAASATSGLAQTPCDVLPPTVSPALCQPCPGGPPVPGARIAGVGLDYVDKWHAQCEAYAMDFKSGASKGTGNCKRDTTCLPGWERFQDGGVWKCRQPATAKLREDCYSKLPLSITSVNNDQDIPNPTLYPGPGFLFVRGPGAANATSGGMTGGIVVTVGEAAGRVGDSAYCLPPNCQNVRLEIPPGAAGSWQTLTLFTPHKIRTATATLYVSHPRTPATVYGGKKSGGGAGPTVTPTRTPTPRPARFQSADAGMSCPGPNFQSGQSQVVEVRSAQVQATATAQYLHTTVPSGGAACVWDDAFQFTIKGLDGQGDVTVSWIAAHAANYANPLSLSTSQTITLPRGRWQIVPDATFPPDFTYSVSFTD